MFTARLAKRAKVMFSLCVSVHRGGVLSHNAFFFFFFWKKKMATQRRGARAVRLLRSRRRTVLWYIYFTVSVFVSLVVPQWQSQNEIGNVGILENSLWKTILRDPNSFISTQFSGKFWPYNNSLDFSGMWTPSRAKLSELYFLNVKLYETSSRDKSRDHTPPVYGWVMV